MKYVYMDKMSVRRMQEVIDSDDMTTTHVLAPVDDLQDIPCHASIIKADEQTRSIVDSAEIITRLKLFCDTKHHILAGDEITVKKRVDAREVVYEGTAGKPVFGITQEITLLEKEST